MLYQSVVIHTNGLVDELRDYLPSLTADVENVLHDVLRVTLDSIHDDKQAKRQIEMMVASFEDALNQVDSIRGRTNLVEALENLAFEVYAQVKRYHLYNKEGLLMYFYMPHPDPSFPDIILNPIIQLTYNPTIPCYESPAY